MTKRSAVWMGVLAMAVVVVGLYLFLRSWTERAGITPAGAGVSGGLLFCSAAVAIVTSAWLTHLIIRWLSTGSLVGGAQRSTATSITAAYILAAVSFPVALFFGVTIGGTLGGGWGERLIGPMGAVIGLGVGLFGITMLCVVPAAVAGYLLGILITKLLPSQGP